MKLPALERPQQYQGLFVFDFGDWTAVGYTAEEIAVLLESEPYADGKVYRIVRARPDGQLELKGVAATRFQSEAGMLFERATLDAARADFAGLKELAADGGPCRAKLQLADRGEAYGPKRYVTALIYPAEYDEDVARWLLDAEYAGGDTVEGGISPVSNYYETEKVFIERAQLWSHATSSRSAEEVLRTVRQAIQR
jgi:hypothetical protein